MSNIFFDEKRCVRIGEVCAISLNHIYPVTLRLEPPSINYDMINFYPELKSISSDNEITFIKYVGNGTFIDLISDQLLTTVAFNEDDFGTDNFNAMEKDSQDEIEKMHEFWLSIQNPANKAEFSDSFSIFIQNPLIIDIAEPPFMSINSEIAKKFASQSLEQVKSKIISSKLTAQQELRQQYAENEKQIIEYLNSKENDNSSKIM